MRIPECVREQELVALIVADRWPSGCPADLQHHVRECAVCSDVVLVASALYAEQAHGLEAVKVPPAGLVWWKSELRARQNATRVVERPLTMVHAFAGAAAIGVAVALMAGLLPVVEGWLISFEDLNRFGLPIGVVVALAVVTPVALYFVVSDK